MNTQTNASSASNTNTAAATAETLGDKVGSAAASAAESVRKAAGEAGAKTSDFVNRVADQAGDAAQAMADAAANAKAERAANGKAWYKSTPAKIGGGVLLGGALVAAGYVGYRHLIAGRTLVITAPLGDVNTSTPDVAV